MSGAKVVALAAHPAAEAVRSHASALQAGAVAVLTHIERVRAEAGAPNPNHWTGPKHQRGRDLKLVARDIRRDIRAAAKAGRLPLGLVVSVRPIRQQIRLICWLPEGAAVCGEGCLRAMEGRGDWPPVPLSVVPERNRYAASVDELIRQLKAIAMAFNCAHQGPASDGYDAEFSLICIFPQP